MQKLKYTNVQFTIHPQKALDAFKFFLKSARPKGFRIFWNDPDKLFEQIASSYNVNGWDFATPETNFDGYGGLNYGRDIWEGWESVQKGKTDFMQEKIFYPGQIYQRLFDAINECGENPIQSQMDNIIIIVKEDFLIDLAFG
jgi:hypothetical protein